MNFLERIINTTKRMERRYHRARKPACILPISLLTIEVVDPTETPKPRISNADLATLQKKYANEEPDKQYFLDTLYDKYMITRLTHRIQIRDGEIVEKKD
jgi:hypothetical protein